jgi:hypothetical protein
MRQNAETFQRITTFERPGFVPSHHYVREMKRAGILDPDWSPGDPIDVYEIDEAYLRQYWPKGD